MIDGKQAMTPAEIRKMYRDQLIKFSKVGMGNKTENGVVVTQTLIDATKRRLDQLRINKLINQY